MKIEDRVASVELLKELKELGVKQDSIWYYAKFEDDSYLDVRGASPSDPIFQLIQRGYFDFAQFDEIYSAYTVAELGEMLPTDYVTGKLTLDEENAQRWACVYLSIPEFEPWTDRLQFSDTEANARAKMLISLIKEGIIKVGEIK